MNQLYNDQLLNRMLNDQPDKRLQHLLACIARQIRVDAGCIFCQDEGTPGRLALAAVDIQSPYIEQMDAICSWTQSQLQDQAIRQGWPLIVQPEIEDVSLRCGLIWPLMVQDAMVGIVVLFATEPDTYTDAVFDELDTHMQLTKTVLENRQLVERLITTEAISTSSQAIARDPSPQNIVNVLRDYLFSSRVTTCVIGRFGPVNPNQNDVPFEYIEIVGSWSRNLGEGTGVGTRFSLTRYNRMLPQLYSEKFITFTNISQNFDAARADPLTRALIEADNVDQMLMMLLETEDGQMGVLAICAEDSTPFNAQELRSFQIVAEFMTISTVAAGLREQADYVQQGRAALLDAVTDGVIMVLPDENASVLTVNKQFTAMFGPEEHNAQGLPLDELLNQMRIPASARRDLRQQWSEVDPSDTRQIGGEFRISGGKSMMMDIQWYGAPVYEDSHVLGRIYTFHDITPERTAERLRSELLSRISHELRTPLTSIRGFAEFILETSGDELPPLAREYTEIIHKSAKHLNHLFTDMIELNRANAGQLTLQRTQTHIVDVIIEAVARLEPQHRAHQQMVVMDLDDDLPLVNIDIDRMDQVLTNLIGNAIKYSPPGGEIRISTTYAAKAKNLPRSAPSDTATPCIVVCVCDQGKGLTTEDAQRIFLPFYRTEASRADKIEGAGLGLAIAQSIVHMHQGKIWAVAATRHKPGGRFMFTIPLLDE